VFKSRRSIRSVRLVVLLVVIVGVALGTSACTRPFEQVEIPPGEIPDYIRDATKGSEIVWRAFYEQGQHEIAVVYYMTGGSPGFVHPAWAWLVFEDGEPVKASASQGELLRFGISKNYFPQSPPEPHNWEPQEVLTSNDLTGESTYSISACGYAFNRSAHSVVGMTTQGRRFEARVVNGYWILLDLDVEGVDRFESVAVQDARGNVLYTYERIS